MSSVKHSKALGRCMHAKKMEEIYEAMPIIPCILSKNLGKVVDEFKFAIIRSI